MLLEINLPFFNYRSVDCFRLGWPMRADADFFCQPIEEIRVDKDDVWLILNIHYLLVCLSFLLPPLW